MTARAKGSILFARGMCRVAHGNDARIVPPRCRQQIQLQRRVHPTHHRSSRAQMEVSKKIPEAINRLILPGCLARAKTRSKAGAQVRGSEGLEAIGSSQKVLKCASQVRPLRPTGANFGGRAKHTSKDGGQALGMGGKVRKLIASKSFMPLTHKVSSQSQWLPLSHLEVLQGIAEVMAMGVGGLLSPILLEG